MLQKMEGTSRSSTPFISVLIGAATTDNVIAWNTASNTLAIAVDSHDRPGVCILDPACPEEHVILDCDALSQQDAVTGLEWCPTGRELYLMAITAGSKLLLWRHGAAAAPVLCPLSIRDWQLDHVRQLSSSPAQARWLEQPSPWSWQKVQTKPAAGHPELDREGIVSRFGPHHGASQRTHWVRPGLTVAAAVTQQGSLELMWKRMGEHGQPSWHTHSASLALTGNVLSADVAADAEASLRVIAVTDDNQRAVHIMTLSGDPTLGVTEALQIITHTVAPALNDVLCCRLRGSVSSGIHASIVQQGPDECQLSVAEVSETMELGVPTTADLQSAAGTAAQVRLHNLVSGQACVSVVSSTGLQCAIFRAHEAPKYVLESDSSTGVAGMCLSPNNTCAAVIFNRDGAMEVQILDLNPEATETPDIALNAKRLCWSFVTKTSYWDVLQYLNRLPASSPVLPAVLAGMDSALHCERYTPRPAYSNLLAALKLQLLTGSPDPIAQIVSQDLRAMVIFHDLSAQLKSLCSSSGREASRAPAQVIDSEIAHEDALQLEPWMSWAQAYAGLLLRCAARWAKGQASGAARADALPCIRLLPDSYFTKHLDEVLAAVVVGRRSLQEEPGGLQALHEAQALHKAAKALCKATLESSRKAAVPGKPTSEDLGGQLAFAQSAQTTFEGQYRLHYHRTLGGCNPVEAFTTGPEGALAEWLQPYDGLSDSSLADVPRRLGLLRDVRPCPTVQPAHPSAVLPWASDCSGALVGTPDITEESGERRLKRWRADREESMGAQQTWRPAIDDITGQAMTWASGPLHTSVDGLSSSAVMEQEMQLSGASTALQQAFLSSSCGACPITGSRWQHSNKRHHSWSPAYIAEP